MNQARQDQPAGRRIASLPKAQALAAVRESTVLAVSCVLTYWLVTVPLYRLYSQSLTGNRIGALWAVIATVFVLRESYRQSVAAAVSRVSATLVSFVLCLVYLVFLPFRLWALGLLIGATALVVTLIGRRGDEIVAAITTAVVMIVAAVSPEPAWHQPILRLADTIVGVAVGVLAAWLDQRVVPAVQRRRPRRPVR